MSDLADFLAPYNNILSVLTYVLGILGFVPAVITFIIKNIRDARELENQIFYRISDTNQRINEILLNHPQLGASWFQNEPTKPLTADERVQQHILFDMITALFEEAYLAYQRAPNVQRKAQWAGWEQFIKDYCQKPNYQRWWLTVAERGEQQSGGQFDTRFEAFISRNMSPLPQVA
jgi:hypothetical protein